MITSTTGSQPVSDGTAEVVGRPPIILLLALMTGLGMDHVFPLPFPVGRIGFAHWISAAAAAAISLSGAALMIAGIRNLTRADTPVQTNRSTRDLVTTGVHGWTRNPIYLGMILLQIGIALMIRSSWVSVAVLPFAVVLRYGVVAREEAYLEERFGEAYRCYASSVRRWF